MSGKRVVITGVGMVTSLASSAPDSWSSILTGKSGVKKIMSFDTEKLPCKIASEISDFKAEDYITPGDVRKMDRFIHLGIAAAIEAVEDSNILPQTDYDKDRTGVIIGSGIGGLSTIEKTSVEFHNSARGKVSPYFMGFCCYCCSFRWLGLFYFCSN
jgi:3-oxoacyl-[acyl-carrier-protein] synthase II